MIYNSPFESIVSHFNLPTDVGVSVVTMHTLVYSSHVKYDKDNEISSLKVNTVALWSHRGLLGAQREPDYQLVRASKYVLVVNL